MPRLDQRQRLDQPRPPGLGALAEQALELAIGLPALRLGLGADQIGQALDRGEIEPAVLERAAGELAGLGRPAALDPAERRQHARRSPRGRHAAAARPCPRRSRCAAPGNHSASASSIDLAARRIAHARQRRLARLRHAADQLLKRNTRARPGDAHHRNRRRRPAGGQREDGGTIRHDRSVEADWRANASLRAGGTLLALRPCPRHP